MPAKLTKEQLKKYSEFLKGLELEDIWVKSDRYTFYDDMHKPTPGNFDVRVSVKKDNTEIDVAKGRAIMGYEIVISEKEKIIFKDEIDLVVNLQISKDSIDEIFSDNALKEFFIGKQLVKITWPFIREIFYTNLARVGIRPIILPFLK
ncbi:hypothetical protein JYK00_03070 [Thermosipho ferrireducens]|uniref:Preprotein translocase subunit SecB n=1 Tax=Thermosipho ferrireducens TaxID=2571116 RepID=A0ABX7S7D7_9BACT|nr:hypothetical protein [Thermosipho ferrireducens]QTA38517.1 hypothetical protein JYK00_03070 [Thermosipho ferrireducens]